MCLILEADEKEDAVDDHVEQVPHGHNNESDAREIISQAAVDEEPKVNTADDNLPEEKPEVKTANEKVSETESATDPDHEEKSVRGRRAKTVKTNSAVDKQKATEDSEDPVIPAPVRGRRGKKTEAAAPPAVRQTTRSRNAKTTESRDVEVALEKSTSLPSKVALKPKRGRSAKKASDDQAELDKEVATEAEMVPEPESEQTPTVDVNQEANNNAAPLEKAVVKPKRGRKAKQPDQPVPEQEEVPCTHSDDLPQADMAKGLFFPFCVAGLNRNHLTTSDIMQRVKKKK